VSGNFLTEAYDGAAAAFDELQMKRSFSASSGSSVQAGTSLGVLSDIEELNNEGQGTMNTNANMATPGGPP
jgi:hypothetical protein